MEHTNSDIEPKSSAEIGRSQAHRLNAFRPSQRNVRAAPAQSETHPRGARPRRPALNRDGAPHTATPRIERTSWFNLVASGNAYWPDFVGPPEEHSMSYAARTIGGAATAMGWSTRASGVAATAMGDSTSASGVAATAMGWSTSASGGAATAMGDSTNASGDVATAMGEWTRATARGRGVHGQLHPDRRMLRRLDEQQERLRRWRPSRVDGATLGMSTVWLSHEKHGSWW